MQTQLSTTRQAGELSITYTATLYKDEPMADDKVLNGITDVMARIDGDGISLTRIYLCTGQYFPAASRLTEEENAAILEGAMALFDTYGCTDHIAAQEE